MVYTLRFFSLKCSLFHNSNLFGFCIIHILYTECAKIKKIIPVPKGYPEFMHFVNSDLVASRVAVHTDTLQILNVTFSLHAL